MKRILLIPILLLISSLGLTHWYSMRALDNPVPTEQRTTSLHCVDSTGVTVASASTLAAIEQSCGALATQRGGVFYVEERDSIARVTRTHEIRGSTSLRVTQADASLIVVGGGAAPSGDDNNPDGYASPFGDGDNPDLNGYGAGIWASNDYTTGTTGGDDIDTGNGQGVWYQADYLEGEGIGGSDCWGMTWLQASNDGGSPGEGDAWPWQSGIGQIPLDSHNQVFVSFAVKMTAAAIAGFVNEALYRDTKVVDIKWWSDAGDPGGEGVGGYAGGLRHIALRFGRSAEHFDKIPEIALGGPRDEPAMPEGYASIFETYSGANNNWSIQGTPPDFDDADTLFVNGVTDNTFQFDDYANQWVWFMVAFDGVNEVNRIYVKTESGAFSDKVYKIIDRPFVWPWTYDLYETEHTDWPDRGNQSIPPVNRGISSVDLGVVMTFPFSDTLTDDGIYHLKLDSLRIGNGWFDPPF